jgi:hypothetical protein
MSYPATKESPAENPTAIEMVEQVDTSAEVAGFKDAHQAAVAAALVPVGGVYLTPEEMKMVRRDQNDTFGKSKADPSSSTVE